MTPTHLRAPQRPSTPHRAGKKEKENHSRGEAERCTSFPEHKPLHLGIRDRRPSSYSSQCQPATAPAAVPGISWEGSERTSLSVGTSLVSEQTLEERWFTCLVPELKTTPFQSCV